MIKNNISNFEVKKYIFLHLTILLYMVSTISSKYASNYQFLSFNYLLFLSISVLFLGVYALLWQQSIKNFEPSTAYSNKSITTLWTILFSAILFDEHITFNNIVGSFLIIFGIILINARNKNKE